MEQFKQIYRILSTLHTAMDLKEWDSKLLSPEALGISPPHVVEAYGNAP